MGVSPDSKPHVILLAYYYPPLNAIGALRPFRFHKYLTRMGYTCEVVTATAQTDSPGPDIISVPDETAALWEKNISPAHPSLAYQLERIARKAALPGHVGLSWSWRAAAAVRLLVGRQQNRKVVLLTTYPPISVLLAGLLVSRKSNVPWIADFRDPLACVPDLPAKPQLLRPTITRVEAMTFRRAAALIANTSTAGDTWRQVYPNHAGKVSVIWNGYDPEDQPQALPIPVRDHKLLVHAGSLYGGRNANQLVEALRRVSKQPGTPAVRLKLVGDTGAESGVDQQSYQQAVAEGWLEFVPQRVPRPVAQQMAGEADGLVLIQPGKITVVAKLYDYICIGRPILAIAYPDSAMNGVLKKSGIPFVLLPPDADADTMDRKIIEYLSLPSEPTQPSAWFREQFDVTRHVQQLAEMIDRVS